MIRNSILMIIALSCTFSDTFSQSTVKKVLEGTGHIISASIGPVWIQDFFEYSPKGDRLAWQAEAKYGRLWYARIGLGISTGITWHEVSKKEEIVVGSDQIERTIWEKKRRIIPVCLFLHYAPRPKARIQPVLKGEAGLNIMDYTWVQYDANNNPLYDESNGYYFGILLKGALDIHYKLGDYLSLFLGGTAQYSRVERRKEDANNLTHFIDLNGGSLRFGVQLIL